MDLKLKTTKKHSCGCTVKQDGIMWTVNTYCPVHQPNFQKKADKLMSRKDKKRGRGYTKSDKKK